MLKRFLLPGSNSYGETMTPPFLADSDGGAWPGRTGSRTVEAVVQDGIFFYLSVMSEFPQASRATSASF